MIKIILFCSVLLGAALASDPSGLYSNNENITELDASEFYVWSNETWYQHASVIQFYRSTSAKSKKFVPTYIEAAKFYPDLKVLKFYAVDCRKRENCEICKKYGFKNVPLILCFASGTNENGLGITVPPYDNAATLIKEILHALRDDGQTVLFAKISDLL